MKIAIAVESDEMQVAKRMGRAPWFAIYKLEGEQFSLLKMVVNEHAKDHHGESGHHHHESHNESEIEHHRQHITALKGVDVILARAVGPNMKDALSREGITVYRLSKQAGQTAAELMNYFIQNRNDVEKAPVNQGFSPKETI